MVRRLFGLPRDTYLLAFTSLFADVSTEMLYPVLPIFVTQVLGASARTLGAIEGVATATQYLVQGPSRWLSDRFRSHRLLPAGGYLLAAVAKPLIGTSTSWTQALAGRFVDRAGTGTRSALRDALIAASVSDELRGRAFGPEGLGDNLGAFIGPLLALLLLFNMRYPIRSLSYLAILPGSLRESTKALAGKPGRARLSYAGQNKPHFIHDKSSVRNARCDNLKRVRRNRGK